MEIIRIRNNGYVYCKSVFYSVLDNLNDKEYCFTVGTNELRGGIDSGIFAISYLISMYDRVNKKKLFLPCEANADGRIIPLRELAKRCCYMDFSNPLFSSKRKSVRRLIEIGLKKSKKEESFEEIKEMFRLDFQRVSRPVSATGNERFRAMAAIGYSYGKEVFCFPWLSKKRLDYYGKNISWLLEKIEDLKLCAIFPHEE